MRPRGHVRRTVGLLVFASLILGTAPAASAAKAEVSADLDGQPIRVVEISKYHCHDLDYPRIHCFRTAAERAAAPSVAAALLAVTYVTIWDGAMFAGASMDISQDYDALVTIGWNDRIGSFKARNSRTGRFFIDWFGGGTGLSFCCNQSVSSLGSNNNAFSSVYHT
jgi:hypothetical protein